MTDPSSGVPVARVQQLLELIVHACQASSLDERRRRLREGLQLELDGASVALLRSRWPGLLRGEAEPPEVREALEALPALRRAAHEDPGAVRSDGPLALVGCPIACDELLLVAALRATPFDDLELASLRLCAPACARLLSPCR